MAADAAALFYSTSAGFGIDVKSARFGGKH